MNALIATLHVKPEFRERLIEEMKLDAQGSLQNEPGCLQFEVLADDGDANCFHLYEIYQSPEAFEFHTQTPHFKRWRTATKDMLAQPTRIIRGTHLYPPERV